MKSVGEAMAVGRTWQESFNKALRSLETGLNGSTQPKDAEMLADPDAQRIDWRSPSRTPRASSPSTRRSWPA